MTDIFSYEYSGDVLPSISDAPSDPVAFFLQWFNVALQKDPLNASAMTLATINKCGDPDARIVLLKGCIEEKFIFFTNYNSCKGQQLQSHPHAALVFYWPQLCRQVRVEGYVSKVSPDLSDSYFNSRPDESKVSSIVSPQSSSIPDRKWLIDRWHALKNEMGYGMVLQRPEYWGGYQLSPKKVEFWQGQPFRLNDRLLYLRDNNDQWKIERLAP
ncbi:MULTISPECIES: pyridoxamine 5'-phosphate oxidase [Candidatus Ichthyocystis]|uniref:pyridoxamine 5'-phosphate oxidase n=1 Tax=Candidatus Ichthyocystis TaxID=2929841 RepID=UPI000B89AA0A|nr:MULTISPECIES: pyridoxamine 5'-phosphate oxidase [Ichthyocystis]